MDRATRVSTGGLTGEATTDGGFFRGLDGTGRAGGYSETEQPENHGGAVAPGNRKTWIGPQPSGSGDEDQEEDHQGNEDQRACYKNFFPRKPLPGDRLPPNRHWQSPLRQPNSGRLRRRFSPVNLRVSSTDTFPEILRADKAARISAGEAKRSSGFLDRARRMIGHRVGGRSGLTKCTGTGSV